MAAGIREQRHEDFTADKIDIMVATSAFGMGIDKANIRWVAHVALPDSPDSYFQEIGRSGRDGAPAHAMLLWRAEDEAIQRFFTGGSPDEEDLRDLAAALRSGPQTKTALKAKTGFGPRKLGQYLGLLEQVGAAVSGDGTKTTVPLFAPLPAAAATAALAEHERQQVVTRSRTDMMRGFAETRNCRTQTLLAYFGEQLKHRCGHCDNCARRRAEDREGGRAVRRAQPGATRRVGRRHGDGLRGGPDDRPLRRGRLQDPLGTGRAPARAADRSIADGQSFGYGEVRVNGVRASFKAGAGKRGPSV